MRSQGKINAQANRPRTQQTDAERLSAVQRSVKTRRLIADQRWLVGIQRRYFKELAMMFSELDRFALHHSRANGGGVRPRQRAVTRRRGPVGGRSVRNNAVDIFD